MKTSAAVAIVLALLAIVSPGGRAQSAKPAASAAPTPLSSLAKALSGRWRLDVRFEPGSVAGSQAIEGPGEESWTSGPGGIDLIEIEQEHISLLPAIRS